MCGMIVSPQLYLDGVWHVYLTPQGKNYFCAKEDALSEKGGAPGLATATRKKYDVFISHANKDKLDYVDELFVALDCLNVNYDRWETGAGDMKSDLDFANELGFMQRSKSGKYSFYVQRFQPAPDDVMNCEDNPFIFEDLNQAVKEIFDLYIAVLKDFLRVKLAYTEFLDKYIHSESKYLSDAEIANRFIKYAKESERKHDYERLISSSSMKMGHEVYHRSDGKAKLCEVYTFDSLGAFLYFDFFRGLSQSYIPKRCDNCGMFFLLEAGKYSSYCERPLEDDPEKTCRDVGARKKYGDKCKTDPVWLVYNRAYKTHYARYRKKKMTIAEFEQWSRQAIEWRNQAETGALEQAEYERLLKK